MLSSNQYYKQYPSSNFDDLFTFPVDIVFDEEFNKFANSNDDDAMILSELDLSSDVSHTGLYFLVLFLPKE